MDKFLMYCQQLSPLIGMAIVMLVIAHRKPK